MLRIKWKIKWDGERDCRPDAGKREGSERHGVEIKHGGQGKGRRKRQDAWGHSASH